MVLDPRVGCSSISLRHLPLPAALAVLAAHGFAETDLGALPGVCDHVPFELDDEAVESVAAQVARTPLRVRSLNADVGALNRPLTAEARARTADHLDRLLTLTVKTGARALVLPCGDQSHDPIDSLEADLDLVAQRLATAAEAATAYGVELWVEHLHVRRLSWNLDIATMLAERLPQDIGLVLDVSHVVASGGDPADFIDRFGTRITHVHLRDARPGSINHSIGNGDVDFPGVIEALAATGYDGHYSLELETRDVDDDDRAAVAHRAGAYISDLVRAADTARSQAAG